MAQASQAVRLALVALAICLGALLAAQNGICDALPSIAEPTVAPHVLLQRDLNRRQHMRAAGLHQACQSREAWAAGLAAPIGLEPEAGGLLGRSCQRLDKVCLLDNEFVLKGVVPGPEIEPADAAAKFVHGPQPFSPMFNWPGYFDTRRGAQESFTPGAVRIGSTADVPELEDPPFHPRAPVVLYSDWVENFAESMKQIMLPLALWSSGEHPELHGRPLLVATPHGTRLSGFWQLLNSFMPTGALEDAGRRCDGLSAMCFDRLYRCDTPNVRQFRDRADDVRFLASVGRGRVAQVVSRMSGESCQALGLAAPGNARGRVFRVWFEQRDDTRRILNMDELVAACKSWRPQGYSDVECHAGTIKDSYKAACTLRAFDAFFGIHGSGLMNGLFLRPGRGAVVEAAAQGFAPPLEPVWCSFRRLFNGTDILYFSYAAPIADTEPGMLERIGDTRGMPLRDRSIRVRWEGLRNILEAVAAIGGNRQVYEALSEHSQTVSSVDVLAAKRQAR